MNAFISKPTVAIIVSAGVLLGSQWASAGNLPGWGGATTTTNQPQVQQPGQPLVSEPAPVPAQTVQPPQPGTWTAPGTISSPTVSTPEQQQRSYQPKTRVAPSRPATWRGTGSQKSIRMTPVNPTATRVGSSSSNVSNKIRFKVTFNGLEVISPSNHETGDGKGDEVFVETRIFRVRKDGTVTQESIKKSLTMGSIKKHRERIKAGTASKYGGFTRGDKFPPDINSEGLTIKIPDGRPVLPMVVFDDYVEMGNEAVLIVPTIWEWDNTNKRSALDKWENWINTYMLPFAKRFPDKFLNQPPRFTDGNQGRRRSVSGSKYDPLHLNPVEYTKSDIGQTRPFNITCPSRKASEMQFYPGMLILNDKIAMQPGQSEMYYVSYSDFCSTLPLAVGWSLSGHYYLYAAVEMLEQ
ncbi:MAG: hypothetical protein ACC669_03925 [bacterium]